MLISPNADPSSSTCYFSETEQNDHFFPICKRFFLNLL